MLASANRNDYTSQFALFDTPEGIGFHFYSGWSGREGTASVMCSHFVARETEKWRP